MKLGFIFQQFNLMPRANAMENVMLPALYAGMNGKKRKARAIQLLERVGLIRLRDGCLEGWVAKV